MPKPKTALITVLATSFSLVSAVKVVVDAQTAEGRPCPRKDPRSFSPAVVTVIEGEKPPCRFAFRPTGVQLNAVPDGSRPDPGSMVVRDSNGRFYTANARGWGGVISVWDARGEYVTSVGRAGEGPGELTDRGGLNIFIDGDDRLHVRDGGFNWSVFSPEHEFLRRVPAHVMEGFQRTTVILDNGMALTSNDGYDDRTRYFRLVDTTGTILRTFGPVGETISQSRNSLRRTLAYGGDDTFWVGPAQGDPRGYLLEAWRIDGTLRRAFLRDVPWFDSQDEEGRVAVEHLHIDDSGLLYVMVIRATEDFAEVVTKARNEGRRLTREERSAVTEAVVEMIDTRTGELLASEVYPVSEARSAIPTQLFRGGKQGAVYKEGPDGLPLVDIVAVELEAR